MKLVEGLLRAEFRRRDPGVPASRDEMLARVARVRRRRGAAAAGFAAVGLATSMIGVAAVMLPVGLPGSAGQFAGSGGDTGTPRYTGELINVIFTDADHGYALQEYCGQVLPPADVPSDAPTPDLHQQCRSQLLVTADSGRSWRERTLPGDPATKDTGVEIVPFHSLMFWVDEPGTLALGGWDRRYWTTTDGGRTWHESSTPRDVGPASSLAVFGRGDRPAFLATYPPGRVPNDRPKTPVLAASDGSFWVPCADTSPCAQVTRDQGQTWQTQPLGGSVTAVAWVATANGQTVYAGARDGSEPRLLRSTDGGTSWALVPDVTGLPEHSVGTVLPNGDLVMIAASETSGMYRLKPGATTLEKFATALAHPSTPYLTGGVLVAGPMWAESAEPDLTSLVSVSPDNGVTWFTVPAPTA